MVGGMMDVGWVHYEAHVNADAALQQQAVVQGVGLIQVAQSAGCVCHTQQVVQVRMSYAAASHVAFGRGGQSA